MKFGDIGEWLLTVIGVCFIVGTIIAFSFGQEPELGKWRWANDTMELTHDKETHAAGSFGLYYLFTSKGMTRGEAINTITWLGLFKEGIDALVPWEQYGSWGGDGFSKNDVVYNAIGVGSAYLIDKLWEKKGHGNETAFIKIHPGYVRVYLYFD